MCRSCQALRLTLKTRNFDKQKHYHIDLFNLIKYLLIFVPFSYKKLCHFLDDDVRVELFKGTLSKNQHNIKSHGENWKKIKEKIWKNIWYV